MKTYQMKQVWRYYVFLGVTLVERFKNNLLKLCQKSGKRKKEEEDFVDTENSIH